MPKCSQIAPELDGNLQHGQNLQCKANQKGADECEQFCAYLTINVVLQTFPRFDHEIGYSFNDEVDRNQVVGLSPYDVVVGVIDRVVVGEEIDVLLG